MKQCFRLSMANITALLALLTMACTALALPTSESKDIKVGEAFSIQSEVLNEERRIMIGLPNDYFTSSKKYPVLYVLDGEFFFYQALSAVKFFSETGYIYNQLVPQMIVVGIVNVDRNKDFTPTYAPNQLGSLYYPTSGKADNFTRFLKKELIPRVDSSYRTQPSRTLAGWSFGGLFTVHTYFENPDLFSSYLAISPSLWWDEDRYVEKTRKFLSSAQPARKPLTVTLGALEGGNIGRSVRDGFAQLMKQKLDVDFPFELVEIPGEGHSFVPYKAFYEGLISVYADWPMPYEKIEQGLDEVTAFYKNLSASYGYEVKVTEWAYMNLINHTNRQGELEKSLAIVEQYARDYPGSSWNQLYFGRVYERMKDYEAAKQFYAKALEVERSMPQPDPERIVTFSINVDLMQAKLKNLDK